MRRSTMNHDAISYLIYSVLFISSKQLRRYPSTRWILARARPSLAWFARCQTTSTQAVALTGELGD